MLEDFAKGRRVEFTGGNFSSEDEDLRDDESYAQTAVNCPGRRRVLRDSEELKPRFEAVPGDGRGSPKIHDANVRIETQQSLKALFLFLILFSALTYGITAADILG